MSRTINKKLIENHEISTLKKWYEAGEITVVNTIDDAEYAGRNNSPGVNIFFIWPGAGYHLDAFAVYTSDIDYWPIAGENLADYFKAKKNNLKGLWYSYDEYSKMMQEDFEAEKRSNPELDFDEFEIDQESFVCINPDDSNDVYILQDNAQVDSISLDEWKQITSKKIQESYGISIHKEDMADALNDLGNAIFGRIGWEVDDKFEDYEEEEIVMYSGSVGIGENEEEESFDIFLSHDRYDDKPEDYHLEVYSESGAIVLSTYCHSLSDVFGKKDEIRARIEQYAQR